MATGYLKVIVVEEQIKRISSAEVLIDREGMTTIKASTKVDGMTDLIPLETVDKNVSLDENSTELPFYIYQVTVKKEGFQDAVRDNVTIFDGQTSSLFVNMTPLDKNVSVANRLSDGITSQENIIVSQGQISDALQVQGFLDSPLLPTPIIPATISVKLGTPQSNAEIVSVDYIYYIKNVASSEIYPTWPDASLRANIYAIQSIALNRVYTEWYRQRGYDFQITSSTAFDQKFIPDRVIYDSIATIVDEIYTQYVHRIGFVEPLFTTFCDGKQVVCDGLHQWKTVDYANLGYSPIEILMQFYGDNIEIARSAIIQDVAEGFTGDLKLGDTGPKVLLMQVYMLRISVNYPAIPQLFLLDGVFDLEFELAVKEFQRIFNLPVTGVIDRDTWYKISFVYHGVKKLAQLSSEGVISPIEYMEFTQELKSGDFGTKVLILQYGLNVISQSVPEISRSQMDAKFGPKTKRNVELFQRHIGLPVTGVVNRETWEALRRYYLGVTQRLPESFELMPFPGKHLTIGDEGLEVRTIQQYLNIIAESYRTIPSIFATGKFDEAMANQVRAFQKEFNINPTGVIDEVTWNLIANIYKAVLPVVLYPGYTLRYDDTSYYVAVLQDYLNTVAKSYPNIPTSVVDEWFGPETLESVKAFQRQFGLKDDGLVGKETWNKLLQEYVELTLTHLQKSNNTE